MRLQIASDLSALSKGLAKLDLQVVRAMAQGLNKGGDKVRTQVRRAMREQTSLVKLKSVTSRSSTLRAFAGKLEYAMIFRGKPPTKPDEFKTTVKTGPGGGVTIIMWGVAHTFPRSFQQKFKGGLRMRLGRSRLPIRSFDGPNLAKEAVKDHVAETFLTGAATIVAPEIEREIARLL